MDLNISFFTIFIRYEFVICFLNLKNRHLINSLSMVTS
jgi:hypothetical protein